MLQLQPTWVFDVQDSSCYTIQVDVPWVEHIWPKSHLRITLGDDFYGELLAQRMVWDQWPEILGDFPSVMN